jgi:N6-adenosine-specific RNA methylase IME4
MLLAGLDDGRFRTILADPPWPERGGGKVKRGADRHYDVMKVRDMPALMKGARSPSGDPLWLPATNAHLYMWVTNNYLEDGLWLMRELGFVYKTNLPWVKVCDDEQLSLEPLPRTKAGLGQYFQGEHELLLFGVRGKGLDPSVKTDRRDLGTVMMAPHPRTGEKGNKIIHSRKPPCSYERIEARSKGPYLEMFARRTRPGWTSWGNQVAA